MDPCKYEKEIHTLVEATRNFKDFMHEIKDNHLTGIYKKLDAIVAKMANRRPTWMVLWVITALATLCGILITALLTNG